MLLQRFGAERGIEPGEHVPVRSLSDVCCQCSLAAECHRWNIAAVRVLHRRVLSTLGDPQQIKRGAHVHLLLNHGAKPGPGVLALEVRFFPSLEREWSKVTVHHGTDLFAWAELQVQRAEVIVRRDPHVL